MNSIYLCLACWASLNTMLDCDNEWVTQRFLFAFCLHSEYNTFVAYPLALCSSQSSQQFYVRDDFPVAYIYAHPAPIFSILHHPHSHTHTHTHSSSNFKLKLHFQKLSPTPQQPARTNNHHNQNTSSPEPKCHVEAQPQCLATLPLECLATAAALALVVVILVTDTLTVQAVDPTLLQAVT